MSRIKQSGLALVIKGLKETDSIVDAAAATGLARGLLATVSIAQRRFLSGPRPEKLDVRSRKLLNSISYEVVAGKGRIVGRLGTNIKYAAFHEFGFHGVVNVKAHTRMVATLDVTGSPIDERRSWIDRAGNVIGWRDTRAQAASRTGSRTAFTFVENVRAHTRQVNYKGRPYLRPALTEALPAIKEQINKELRKWAP